MSSFYGRLRKIGNKLIFEKKGDEIQYESLRKHLLEGAIVEMYVEEVSEDGSLGQLAKIHLMLKKLSHHTGESVANLKLMSKDKAGLCIIRTIQNKEYFDCKSLGKCSSEELSLVIQSLYEIGESVNYPLE